MVRISDFHPDDPGSRPGVGIASVAQLDSARVFNSNDTKASFFLEASPIL